MQYRSGWEQFSNTRFLPNLLCARAEEVLAAIGAAGVRIPPGNRIELALRRVTHLNCPGVLSVATEEEMRIGSEAFRTLWDFFFIGYTWRERPRVDSPITVEQLSVLLEGAEDPMIETNSRARDTQFELYTAANFLLAGAAVRKGEPDWQFLYYGQYLGMAAKRVRTLTANAVRNAVRDAVRQIQSSTGAGFIALNIETRLAHQSSTDPINIGDSFNKAVGDAHAELYSRSDRKALRGALLFGTTFAWNTGGDIPFIEFQMPYQVWSYTESEAEVQQVRAFFDPLEQRLANAIAYMSRLTG